MHTEPAPQPQPDPPQPGPPRPGPPRPEPDDELSAARIERRPQLEAASTPHGTPHPEPGFRPRVPRVWARIRVRIRRVWRTRSIRQHPAQGNPFAGWAAAEPKQHRQYRPPLTGLPSMTHPERSDFIAEYSADSRPGARPPDEIADIIDPGMLGGLNDRDDDRDSA